MRDKNLPEFLGNRRSPAYPNGPQEERSEELKSLTGQSGA